MRLIPLGLTFGLLIVQTGFSWWWVPILSVVVYAEPIELLAVDLAMTHTGLLGCVVTSFMINFRHVLYGLAFPCDRIWFRLGRAYPAYALIDESYSIVSATDPDEKMSGHRLLAIQVLYQLLRAGSGIAGLLTGAALSKGIRGARFVPMALFTVLAMDVFETSKGWSPPLLAIVCTLVGWLINPNQTLVIELLMYFGMLLLWVWPLQVNRVMRVTLLSKGCVTKGEQV